MTTKLTMMTTMTTMMTKKKTMKTTPIASRMKDPLLFRQNLFRIRQKSKKRNDATTGEKLARLSCSDDKKLKRRTVQPKHCKIDVCQNKSFKLFSL